MVWKIKPPSPPGVPAARVPSPTFALAAATARLICPENANRLVATSSSHGTRREKAALDVASNSRLPLMPPTSDTSTSSSVHRGWRLTSRR